MTVHELLGINELGRAKAKTLIKVCVVVFVS